MAGITRTSSQQRGAIMIVSVECEQADTCGSAAAAIAGVDRISPLRTRAIA